MYKPYRVNLLNKITKVLLLVIFIIKSEVLGSNPAYVFISKDNTIHLQIIKP